MTVRILTRRGPPPAPGGPIPIYGDAVAFVEDEVMTAGPSSPGPGPEPGVIARATFEDGTIGNFQWGGGSNSTYQILTDPTGGGNGSVVRMTYLPGSGSDVDGFLYRTFPHQGVTIGAGATVYSYGKLYIVPNGFTGNRKVWRYYVGPQGGQGSDITIWHGAGTLRMEGPDAARNMVWHNTGTNGSGVGASWGSGVVAFNTWAELEVQLTMDSSPGAGDGIFRAWLNRSLIYENTAFRFINSAYQTLGVIRMGYQTQSTRPENGALQDVRYWDDLTISTERIAP